jgi:glutamyl-tRNA reductase
LVTNGGSGYSTTPLVTITGDGTGATAEAVVVNQKVQSIVITNRGLNYSRAIITISGGSGFGASAIAVLNTRFGDLRIVYFDTNAERKIVNSKAGTINYDAGLITLNDLQILSSASADGDISIDIESENGIISSQKNTIITIDLADPSSISTDLQTI